MQHGARGGGFHEGNHGGEAGVEDAKAEGGEGALLDGAICFGGQAEGEEGGDWKVEKNFAGEFRGEACEGHFRLDDRSFL